MGALKANGARFKILGGLAKNKHKVKWSEQNHGQRDSMFGAAVSFPSHTEVIYY